MMFPDIPEDFLEAMAAFFSIPLFLIFAILLVALGHSLWWLSLTLAGPLSVYIIGAAVRKSSE